MTKSNKKAGTKRKVPGVPFKPGDPRAGRPVGCKNKISRDMKETLRQTWRELQENPETSLLGLAKDKPVWFYELTKGCFPKDLFIHGELDFNSMSRAEIEARIAELLGAAGAVPPEPGAEED